MAPTEAPEKAEPVESSAEDRAEMELVNASGHRQEVDRNFSLLSICAVAVTTGNTWIAQGGSLVRCQGIAWRAYLSNYRFGIGNGIV